MNTKNAMNLPVHNGERDWSHGIFDIVGEWETCVISICCPCITYSRNKSRLEHIRNEGTPHPEGGDPFTQDTIIFGALAYCGFGWLLQMGGRHNMRQHYSIQGDVINDCWPGWCCHSCALTQESQEIQLEETALRKQMH